MDGDTTEWGESGLERTGGGREERPSVCLSGRHPPPPPSPARTSHGGDDPTNQRAVLGDDEADETFRRNSGCSARVYFTVLVLRQCFGISSSPGRHIDEDERACEGA
ncbi:hypothetical protein Pcinc_013777 [Petrolisthes cinctipes]|uniref:Uncharacterized protein n=1 Tax=Petrolisthes cinctipes TaxID=88211 RepID=A0AAE1FWR6_PETCI|nr:hypothetical protein Pcinc_013777 [Petrolisthes cinctipes]